MMEAAAIAAPSTGSLSRLIAFPCLPCRLLLVDAASGLSPGEASWVPSAFGGANCGCPQFSSGGEGCHAQLRTTRWPIGHHGEVAIAQPAGGWHGDTTGDAARRRTVRRPVRQSSSTVRVLLTYLENAGEGRRDHPRQFGHYRRAVVLVRRLIGRRPPLAHLLL